MFKEDLSFTPFIEVFAMRKNIFLLPKKLIFATNSDFLIPIFLQPDVRYLFRH